MKRRVLACSLLGLAALSLALPLATSPAQADIYVIESSAPAIKVGVRLADKDRVTLPAGSFIRAVLPSGKTQTIRGPYEGTVENLARGQSQNEGVLAWLRNMMATGGARETIPGATRSIGRDAGKPTAAFSWAGVPSYVDGDVCVEKGAALQLLRLPSSRAGRVIVINAASSQRGDTEWAPGNETAVWPAAVQVQAKATYHLIIQDRPARQITLHVLDKAPADDDVLTELQARNCRHQFEVYVREKMTAAAKK